MDRAAWIDAFVTVSLAIVILAAIAAIAALLWYR
jgi:hypothetical protein